MDRILPAPLGRLRVQSTGTALSIAHVMPKKIASRYGPGIYDRGTWFEIRVKRGGKVYCESAPKPVSAAALELRRTRLLESVLSLPASAPRGVLLRDIERYLALSKHLSGLDSVAAHLKAFVPSLGGVNRSAITRQDILAVRSEWSAHGVKPKTINNRISALRTLYRTLDGDDLPTPCDRIKPLRPVVTPAASIAPDLIRRVDLALQERERAGYLRDAKTRARFRVRATTGARPSEIMRAQPHDVDLKRRLWRTRDGKGGFRPMGIPLTTQAVEAWALFIEADAWGPFETSSFARVLRAAGWPATIRPYQLRHALGLALSDHDVDLADVSLILGHAHERTTRKHYVSPQWRRMQKAMQLLDGAIAWETLPADATRNRATGNFSEQISSKMAHTADRGKRAKVAKIARKR